MTILGIDPGTTRVGFGAITANKEKTILIESGCLTFDNYLAEERILYIFKEITELIKRLKPDVVALERVFFSKNKKTAFLVSEARGAITAAVLSNNIRLRNYTPLEVKQAVSAYGRTGKKGIQKMVKLLLELKEDLKSDDAADALALALCCAQQINSNRPNWD